MVGTGCDRVQGQGELVVPAIIAVQNALEQYKPQKTTLQVGVSGGLRGQGGIAVGTDSHGVQRQGTLVAPARVWQYAVQTRNDSIIRRCAHVGGELFVLTATHCVMACLEMSLIRHSKPSLQLAAAVSARGVRFVCVWGGGRRPGTWSTGCPCTITARKTKNNILPSFARESR